MTQGGIAEKGCGGESDVGDDDCSEMATKFGAIVVHGEGEGNDGDVEEGGEDVASA